MLKNKVGLFASLTFVLILTYFGSRFFIDKKALDKNNNPKGALSGTVLDEYLTSAKKTGKFIVTTYMPPNTYHETAFYWINGSQLRVDYYDKNGKRMSVMSEDGKNVYFCDPKYSVCYPTGLPIEQYLLAFYLPSDNLEKLGKNNKTGCDNYKYVTQKTFKVVGTDPYYVEDITYCIIDEELTSFTMRDAFIEKDGSRSDYLTNHYEVKEFGIDADIEQDVFTLLYPMGKEPSRD